MTHGAGPPDPRRAACAVPRRHTDEHTHARRNATGVRPVDPGVGILEEYNRGQLFYDAGDFTEAARILTPVVEQVPDDVAPRLLLARAYFRSAQLLRAEEHLRRVIEKDPTEYYAHLMLGRTLQRLSRHDEARPHLRLAEVMSPPEQ